MCLCVLWAQEEQQQEEPCLLGLGGQAVCLASHQHQHQPATCAVAPRRLWAALMGPVRPIDWGGVGGGGWWPRRAGSEHHPPSVR